MWRLGQRRLSSAGQRALLHTRPTPARRLVESFGSPDEMSAMYSEDVTWRLSHSLAPNIAGPHVGKGAVLAFNEAVFHKFYRPGVRVDILDELGDEASSVVRFNFHAVSRREHSYAVEYVVFAKTGPGGLVREVIELLDTHASNEQHAGNRVGVPPRTK